MIRGFFTTFLMKQRLGILGFGKASLGLGLFFISINSDLSVCKGTNFLRLFLQKLCQTFFSFQRLTLLTTSIYLISIHKNQIQFWLRDEQPRHQAHLFSFPFFNHGTYPWRTKGGKKNVCVITQHFEVTEHEQSAQSCLKKCKLTVKKCLAKFPQNGVLERRKWSNFKPEMTGT